jgi:hypothetical protein
MRLSEMLLQPILRPRLDRRRARLFVAPCRACGDTAPVVVSRTPYVIYLRCCACASVWSVAKPGEAVGSFGELPASLLAPR